MDNDKKFQITDAICALVNRIDYSKSVDGVLDMLSPGLFTLGEKLELKAYYEDEY